MNKFGNSPKVSEFQDLLAAALSKDYRSMNNAQLILETPKLEELIEAAENNKVIESI